MKTCKYCGIEAEDGIIAKHEPICQYVTEAVRQQLRVEQETADRRDKLVVASDGLQRGVEEEPTEFTCSKCGKACKSAAGLISHERTCKG